MLVNLLLVTTLSTLLTGQIIRLPLGQSGAVTLTDIFLGITLLAFLYRSLFIKKSIKIPPLSIKPFVLFCLAATASTIIALDRLTFGQVLVSSLFLIRFIAYFAISVIVYNSIAIKSQEKWINTILFLGLVYAFIGFIQLIFFSDLSQLQMYGWDPHQMRLVSTVLDPNFSGSIFVILSAISLSFYLYKSKKYYLICLIVFVLAIILTFSRSAYLAVATVMATLGVIKAPRVLLVSILVFAASFSLIPQVRNRIIGALTIDETAEARLESWQNALTVAKDNPFVGVGFNTYRYTQANYGFFSFDNPLGGHSGGGSDSSILLVAATTGIVGLLIYFYFLLDIFKILKTKATKNPLHLGALAAFFGLIVDSQFVNSLFFPQVMLIFYFILGLATKNDN